MRIERYEPSWRDAWDGFVTRSRTGTFLHRRDYLEYHADRFTDHSLVLRSATGELIALLPANERAGMLESHGGLTYGGLLFDDSMTLAAMMEIVARLRGYLRQRELARLRYRAVPAVYHRGPADEDVCALVQHGARLVHRAALSVIDRGAPIRPQSRRRRGLRTALAAGLSVAEDADLGTYWSLLSEVLSRRYDAAPVHSLAEIRRLRELFPDNIRLLSCHDGAEMVAGLLLYDTGRVVRTQYIAAGERGKELGALDMLFDHLVSHGAVGQKLDLGTCEGADPFGLNRGVLEFKESWGGRTVAQDTYELDAAL